MLFLVTISQYSSLLPLLVVGIFFKRIDSTLKKLGVLFFCTVILEVLAAWFEKNTVDHNNMFLFHIHSFIETTALSFVFYKIFSPKSKKKTVQILCISFLVFSIINVIFWEPFTAFNSYQRYFEGIIMILFSLLYFHQIFQELKVKYLERLAYFWLSSALLIYFSGTLFLFISYEAMSSLYDNNTYFYTLHSLLNILLNLAYATTIWVGRKSI